MKHKITFSVLLVLFTFYGCKKENSITGNLVSPNLFFDSAIQYLKTHLTESEYQKLDITNGKTLAHKNQNLGVQIFEKGATNKFLVLQSKSSNYSGNWVDISGLTHDSSHFKSGNIILTSLDNSSVTKLVVENNEVKESDKETNNELTTDTKYFNKGKSSGNMSNPASPDVASPLLPEIIIYYDVGSDSGIDYYSWYWLVDQVSSGSYTYFDGGSGSGYSSEGGGGGSSAPPGNKNGANNVVSAITFISPESPILDLNKELKCFTDNGTSTYNISINVNQPNPGSRSVINPLSPYPVGHTYLTFEQHNADGSSIIRNVGFYPKNGVKPGTEKDQSVFGDDTYTPYDVSLNFTVTGSEMNTVLTQIKNQQALQYDLNEFNCTNSAMDALKSININLPATNSDEILFSGNDPGDLGEDLRQLNLNEFSAENGNRNIVRTASNSNNQYPDQKTGTCN